MALSTVYSLCAALQIEISRFVNGEHEPLSATCGLDVQQNTEKNGAIDELHLTLCNKGEETLLHFISSHPESPLLEEAFRRLHERDASEPVNTPAEN